MICAYINVYATPAVSSWVTNADPCYRYSLQARIQLAPFGTLSGGLKYQSCRDLRVPPLEAHAVGDWAEQFQITDWWRITDFARTCQAWPVQSMNVTLRSTNGYVYNHF